jgi:tricorn protease
MEGSSLARFKKEIIEFRLKEALIIDVRYNGGGNIDQQLIDILERRPFSRWITRDSIPHMRPWNCFWGKKLVLINEHSFSDAEIFPMAFKHLGLGKLVGVPTGGGVIATGSYSLIDGSTIRTPYIGCYTLEGINLENLGVKPDVFVENNPDDELAGKDAQLERAVAELLNELGK